MGEFLWFGTMLGASVGFVHFLQFLLTRAGRPGRNFLRHLWHGLWIWALWTLFGAYVLAFWLLGLVLMAISSFLPGKAGVQ